MRRESAAINEISAALSKAQGAFQNPEKDRENPHFRSKYATLSAFLDATRKGLADNGLSVTQTTSVIPLPPGWGLITTLRHASGQWIEMVAPLYSMGKGPQVIGSELTYMRRYCRAAILDVAADEDDDAEASKEAAKASPAAQRAQRNASDRKAVDKALEGPAVKFRVILGGDTPELVQDNAAAWVATWKRAAEKAGKEGKAESLRDLANANAPVFAELKAAGLTDAVAEVSALIRAALEPAPPATGSAE
jgi:ERF superfamily